MKIYDCFTFFNEIELLELRLSLLNNVVDYFVLVEANKTHKNEDKDFIFQRNKKRFQDYIDKIIHIKVDDMPDLTTHDWASENYQRNCIARGLGNCSPEDIILISDMDEIPNPDVIRLLSEKKACMDFYTHSSFLGNIAEIIKFPELIHKYHGMKLLDKTPLALEQSLFYYFVNCKSKSSWYGSVITKAKNLSTPQKLRDKRTKFPRIKDGGWHFSYLGGVERILLKCNSTVDAIPHSVEHINKCIRNGLDLYGRTGKAFEYEFINIENMLPSQVGALVKKYPSLLFLVDPTH